VEGKRICHIGLLNNERILKIDFGFVQRTRLSQDHQDEHDLDDDLDDEHDLADDLAGEHDLVGEHDLADEMEIATENQTKLLEDPSQEIQIVGSLLIELFGKASNLYAINADGAIQQWSHYYPSRGLKLGTPWLPPQSQASPQQADDLDLNALGVTDLYTLESYVSTSLQLLHQEREKQQGRQCFKKLKQKLEKRFEAILGDIEKAKEAQKNQEYGELLKGAIHQIKKGMHSIKVQNWYDPEMNEIEIPLQPMLDASQNVAKYFALYKKGMVGEGKAEDRLNEVDAQIERLNILAQKFEEGQLTDWEEVLIFEGFMPRPKSAKQKKAQARLPYWVFWSCQNEKIWVGKGGEDNHQTTFHFARGQDDWIHVRDGAGCHVIIPRQDRNQEPHIETLRDAAALAVHHSKFRGESHVPLYHTQRKHIRPIPNAPAGKVMVADSRTLTAQDVEERIKRLYEEAGRRGER
jgi:predicted ribosome quality control (RQC) complex YloA/Tae2 family protein